MAINNTTLSSATAWSPDVQAFLPTEVVPDALILKASTLVTQRLEGDAPVARIPWVNDDEADFVAEGSIIPEADPTLSEIVVPTGKISQLLRISREQWVQEQTASLLSQSVQRAIMKRANTAFISNPLPDEGVLAPTGLANTPGIVDGGTITTDLDPLAEAIAAIENNGGQPGVIIANPTAWGALRTLKTGDGSNAALLGAGTEDQAKRLFGIEVLTSPAVEANQLLVIDPTAVASAAGQIHVAQSEHLYFSSDSIALRAMWRIGWAIQHSDRIATVNIDTAS